MESFSKTKFKTVDEYHAAFPENVQRILEEMRKAIKQVAPQAEEVISYNMPGFKLNGMLVWYAAYKAHVGFYPSSRPIEVFKDKLVSYKTSKGAIQFPLDKTLPISLIKEIVQFRIKENEEKLIAKGKLNKNTPKQVSK